jgi:hypothetical protein
MSRRNALVGWTNARASEEEEDPHTMRYALSSKLADLVLLDPLLTAELVAELFIIHER